MEFGPSILTAIASLYTAKDDTTFQLAVEVVCNKFRLLENVLGHGQFFSCETFCIIDAVFGPIFRYFDVFFIFNNLTKVQSYRTALSQRPYVRAAVSENYSEQLRSFLRAKSSLLSQRMSDARADDYQGLSILST
jgi:glutathione S-transferase